MAWHKAATEKEKISLASPNHEADIVQIPRGNYPQTSEASQPPLYKCVSQVISL